MFETRRCRATSPTVRKLPEKLSRASDSDRAFIWTTNYNKHPGGSDQGKCGREASGSAEMVLHECPCGLVEPGGPIVVQGHDQDITALCRCDRQGVIVDVHDRDRRY